MRTTSSPRRGLRSRIAFQLTKLLCLIVVLVVAGMLTRSIDAQGQGRAGAPAGQTPGGGRGAAAEPVGLPIPTGSGTVGTFDSDQSLGASYPRVVELQHYAAGKGQLIATFVRRGGFPIYRSTDRGETWQFVTDVKALTQQPALYEMPHKMGDFPAGTLLLSGLINDGQKSSLNVHVSRDGGATWEFLSTIAEGERAPYNPAQRAFITKLQPVWEPFFYADAKGRLIASFSDERYKQEGYNQLLDHRVSTDGGKTWGDVVFDVAIPDGLTRAGMAIITRAGNGRFYMIYEMVGLPGYPLEPRSNPVHLRTSADGVNFGDPKERGTLIQDRWRQFLWSTPYIVWSPYPAPNGTLVASARGVMRYDLGQVGGGMMINRNNGEGLWTLIDTPIKYTPNPDGYSQTMIPIGDGREILHFVPVGGQLKYVKFKLPETIPELEFPFGPKR